MKKTIFALTLCIGSLFVNAQTVSVEQSTFGIQTGFLGIWAHNETKLTNQIVLRIELGLDTGIFGSDVNDIEGLILVPTITLEPRWYYNLNKRQEKSKHIDGNSGNLFSINISYHPDWFVISNEDNINFISDISIVPTWAIRRHIGNHFTYETGIGIGYVNYFKEDHVNLSNEADVAVNLHLRIGYRI